MQPAQRGGGEPNGWYPNQQYPQQYQTRQFPNQYANGNRYNGPNGQYPQASHDPYFHYHQQQHYIPPNFPPQMGGPGPNTMQNGYMGPGGYSDYPPYMRAQGGPQQPIHAHPQQQVPYPTPPPSDPNPQPPASQLSFAEDSDVTASSHAEAPPYQQQPPPPSIPPSGPHLGHDPSQSGFVSGGPNGYNGMPHNPIPQMQYPYYPPNGYPPNHPYAYGGGVGYPQYGGPAGYQQFVQHGQVSGQYVAGNGPSPSHTRENTGSSSTNSVKGLNPAAAGFTFTPSSRQKETPAQVNGETADAVPVFASIQQPASRPRVPEPSGQVDNPGVEPKKFNLPAMPAMVNCDKFKGVQAKEAPVDHGSLGLSQMDVQAEPSEKPAETSSIAAANGDEASATQSAVEAKQEEAKVVVEESTPAAPAEPKEQVEPSTSAETPVEKASSVKSPIANKWNFVGPTVSGYSSPLPSGANGRAGAAVPETKSPKGNKKAQSVPEGPIHLRSTRPEINSVDGNVYSSSLSQGIPKSVKVVKGDEGEKGSRTPRTRERGNARRAVLAIGDDVALSKSKRQQRSSGLVFGSADAQEIATPEPEPLKQEVEPEPTPQVEVPVPEAEVPEIAEEAQPPAPEVVQTQAPKPRAPPSSWAALLRPAATASSSAVATKASSPAPTVASAGTSGVFSPEASEAGPSRRPTSPLSEGPTTPKGPQAQLPSATPSSVSAKPPPPSTGAASSKAPRPVFNYAAAAAAGANLSPQEELAKLLIDGVAIGKGKAKEGTLTLPRGLINTGNMCFANTILQVLVYCSPFTELFEELGKRLKADLARKTPLLEAMIIFLREFASTPGQAPPSGTSTPKTDANRRDARREAFVPENVYDAMKENKRFDSMRRGFQEDAEEYLGFFLDTLHEEILYILSRTQTSRVTAKSAPTANGDSEERSIARPTSPKANGDGGDGWLEVGKKQKTNVVRNTETKESAVSKLFGGSIRSVLHTPGSKDSVTLEPYQPLQLDIQSSDVTSITDALRHLNQPETVPGVWSASRGQNVDATKQVFIETFPRVLILHLKRFVYDAEERSVVKRSKPVAYGTELIVPPEIITPARRAASPVKYKLFGVVYHHGASASGGHYTVSVAKQDATGWIHFDDETVSTVPTEQVVVSPEEAKEGREGRGILVGGRERCAYLLFYQRVRA